MKPTFFLYDDDGADTTFMAPTLGDEATRRGVDLAFIRGREIAAGVLDHPHALLLVLPGAQSGQKYRDALGTTGCAAIHRAVQSGLAILGTCAGGYLLAETIDYAKEIPGSEKRLPLSPLAMFNATARGELPFLPYHLDNPLRGWHRAASARVGFTGTEADIMYWGGGMLIPTAGENNLSVIARYAGLPGQPIAVAAKSVGHGVALFSGVHSEVSGHALLHTTGVDLFDPQDNGRWRHSLAYRLLKYETERRALWQLKVKHLLQARRAQEALN